MSASNIIHASCVAIGGRGVLLSGRSGTGKSDLTLRLLDRGAVLVSDDYTCLCVAYGVLRASAPPTIAGKLELRGVGIVDMACMGDVPVCLLVDLDDDPTRLPEPQARTLAGIAVPLVALNAREASTPIKVELALSRFGLAT